MANLTDLPGPQGKDNQPGLKGKLWLAPEEDFVAIKGVKKTEAPGDSVTIDGSHTFQPTKGFLEAYGTQDTVTVKMTPVGERDGRGQKVALEFFNPGVSKEAAEFARVVKNRSCIALVQTPDGVVYQLGAAGLGLEILAEYDTGKLSGGRRGYLFKGECYQNGLQFYEGDIVRPDGSKINAVSGVSTGPVG